jgi:hypothetical protein
VRSAVVFDRVWYGDVRVVVCVAVFGMSRCECAVLF